MAFTPVSSIAPATVTVAGSVSVSNFPASQAVTGPLTNAELRALAVPVSGTVAVSAVGGTVLTDGSAHTQPVSGSVGVTNFPATQPVSGTVTANQGAAGVAWPVDASGVAVPVTGPLTNAQLRASAVPVDGSAVTQPVSGTVAATVASLPLPSGAATEATLKRVNGAAQDSALTAILEREKIPA